MITDLKNIHLGNLISQRAIEQKISSSRICKFLKCTESEWHSIQKQKSLDTENLLRLSILLEYDFFRIYSQYLILYAPQANTNYNNISSKKSSLPSFRKNIYTKEVIEFIMEQIKTGSKTKAQIIREYRIPKTTVYKWFYKYHQLQNDKEK